MSYGHVEGKLCVTHDFEQQISKEKGGLKIENGYTEMSINFQTIAHQCILCWLKALGLTFLLLLVKYPSCQSQTSTSKLASHANISYMHGLPLDCLLKGNSSEC